MLCKTRLRPPKPAIWPYDLGEHGQASVQFGSFVSVHRYLRSLYKETVCQMYVTIFQ